MKNIQHLRPEFRARTRELIQGFVEHCEISRSLTGEIRQFIHFAGRKYGLPLFTVYGPPHPDLDTRFIGLIGHNAPGDSTTPEILLQLIERLAIQPHVATGSVLRLLPIADPVALELGQSPPPAEVEDEREHSLDAFRQTGLDGVIHLRPVESERLRLRVSGPAPVRTAAVRTGEVMERLRSEESLLDRNFDFLPSNQNEGEPWEVTLEIPSGWSEGLAVHWISQLLVVFLRSHTEALLSVQPTCHH